MERGFKTYRMKDPNDTPIGDNQIRTVLLPVEVIFKVKKDIPIDWDEDGNILETEDGFVMEVAPNQSFIYNNNTTLVDYLGTILPTSQTPSK